MAKPETSIRLVVRALMSPVFPVLIFLVFLGIASGLRVGLIQQNTHQIQTNLSNEARALANNLEREFMVHLDAIGRMAMRMQANPSQTEALWREDARNYLRDFGVYQAIEWIDRNYIIRWLEPLSGNSDVIGFNVAFNEQRRAALSRAAASGQYDISGIIDLRQGGEGLVIYHPVGRGDANNGFMAGVFRMNTLAEQMLTRRVLEQFQVTITQSDQTSYLLNTSSDLDNSLNHTVPINLPSLDWSLTLTPSRQWVEGQRSSWPTMTFTSLLLMGLQIGRAHV